MVIHVFTTTVCYKVLIPVIEANGFIILMKAIFGKNTLVNVSTKSGDDNKKFLMQDAVKTHPIIISQDFIPFPYTYNPHHIENFTTEGLAKLFAYGNFVRARQEQSKSVESILEMELKQYPYKRKEAFQKPYFSPIDLSGTHEGEFHAALTDSGICMVYNGNTMEGTYRSSKKVKELSEAFDKRDTIEPKKIVGSGRTFEKVFWLNLEDRYVHKILNCTP